MKTFRKLAVIEGLEDVVPCLLKYFGEDWSSMCQLPPTPPLSSPPSLLSMRTSLHTSADHRGGAKIAGVKQLAARIPVPEKCGEKGQLCKEKEDLLEVVLVDEVETIIDSSESDDDGNEISFFELDFPPLAASTPLASLNGLDIDQSSGSKDSSSSGSDWLLGNHE